MVCILSGGWNALPKHLVGLFTFIADGISRDLAGTTTQDCSRPTFVFTFENENPEFIKLQKIPASDKSIPTIRR